jgi:FeS assembly SUF system regulator
VLSLSRKLDYALVAMAELAGRQDETLSARQIAVKYGLPLPTLTNILKELAAGGLVISTRGSKGGYHLSRAAREITLADMIDTIDGPVRLTLCCHEDGQEPAACDLESHCPTKQPLRKVHAMLQGFMQQVTLADLVCDTVQVRFDLAAAGAKAGRTCG